MCSLKSVMFTTTTVCMTLSNLSKKFYLKPFLGAFLTIGFFVLFLRRASTIEDGVVYLVAGALCALASLISFVFALIATFRYKPPSPAFIHPHHHPGYHQELCSSSDSDCPTPCADTYVNFYPDESFDDSFYDSPLPSAPFIEN
jgi:hypothetical protein